MEASGIWTAFETVGEHVVGAVLHFAGLFVFEWVPGAVVLGFVIAVVATSLILYRRTRKQVTALNWLRREVAKPTDEPDFASKLGDLHRTVNERAERPGFRSVVEAWNEYRETMIEDASFGTPVVRNSIRPELFFNLSDLRFGAGFPPSDARPVRFLRPFVHVPRPRRGA